MMDIQGVLSRGCRSSLKVGLGADPETHASTVDRLRALGCHVELVRFDEPSALVSSLVRGELDAAVRGTLSSSGVLRVLKEGFGVGVVMRAAVLADAGGKPFVLAPVGIDEGNDLPSRLALARAMLSYFSALGWDLAVGVLSKGRDEDHGRGEDIGRSLDEGRTIVEALRKDGRNAEHHSILVEDAVRRCELVIAPDGVAGNLMFRTLHFVGGGSAYGAPVVNIPRVFVDTSRAKADFSEPVLLAAGLAVMRSEGRPRD
jgi:putative methanogen marker protein 4